MVPNLTKISLNIILVRIMGVMITYQALLIVNIIRSDFEPKKGQSCKNIYLGRIKLLHLTQTFMN